MSEKIFGNAETVSNAVNEIASGATQQAEEIQSATENVGNIADAVQRVLDSADQLEETAKNMHENSRSSAEQLSKLSEASDEMSGSVNEISKSIGATSDAVGRINERVASITEIASLSLGGVVVSQTLKIGGDAFDQAIVQYIRETYGLYIDVTTAEKIKIGIGSTRRRGDVLTRMEVRGRDIDAGFPRTISITPDQVKEAVSGKIRQIVEAVRTIIEKTPPDLAADIAARGIVLTGGGAQLAGLDKAVQRLTGITTVLCDDPQTAVARGTGQYIHQMNRLVQER